MQISVEKLEGLAKKVSVQLPADVLNEAYDKRLKEVSRTIRLNGFRPGKVPAKVVEQRYGKGIRQEAVGEIIQHKLAEAIDQEQLEPVGMPEISSITDEEGKPFEFTATFEEMPVLELKDFAELTVEKPLAEIKDEDLDTMLENLRQQRATFADVEREAQNGDVVFVDFAGTIDGEAFKGGSAQNQRLELGSGSMIPGFEDGIAGMKTGETKTIDVTFPEDYQAEELKGQAAQFEITLNQLQEKQLPEINEDFIKEMGVESGDIEKFKEEIRKNMTRELKMRLQARQKEAVIQALVEANEFDVPDALVKQEIQRQKQQLMQQFDQQQANIPMDSLPDDLFQDRAVQQVRAGLVLRDIMQKHDVKADGEKVRAYIEEMAAAYDDKDEVINHYYENDNMLQQVEGVVIESQMVDIVLDQAKVEEKQLSYEEAVRPQG
ncbi:MAG: trigger factor [Pseudomonadota bacterium]|nr:trigger factor [Pseudomonadota bacterium]